MSGIGNASTRVWRVERISTKCAIFSVSAMVLVCACSEPPRVPPEGVPLLFRAAQASPELYEPAPDGCVEVHHVWKAQARAVHRTAGGTAKERIQMRMDSAYTPYAAFWDGYVSSGFKQWARRDFDLVGVREPVLEYLEACKSFWGVERLPAAGARSASGLLDEWAAAVRAGERPDFGSNVAY